MKLTTRIKRLFSTQRTTIEVYRDERVAAASPVPDWRWRAVAPENDKILASGEGYSRRIDMESTLDRLFPDERAFPRVEVSA